MTHQWFQNIFGFTQKDDTKWFSVLMFIFIFTYLIGYGAQAGGYNGQSIKGNGIMIQHIYV